jgi:phosphorylcholine metabolism protein LicD
VEERKILTSREFWAKQDKQSTATFIMNHEWANEHLQLLKKVFDNAGITFFLFYGTLLGAIREKDFILYDADVDIGIFGKDIIRVRDLEKELKCLGYNMFVGTGIKSYKGKAILNHIHIEREKNSVKLDIYPLFLQNGRRWWFNHTNKYWIGFPYSAKYFESFKTIEFKGAEYRVPNPPEDFLEEMWGTWWVATGGGQFGIIHPIIFKEGITLEEFNDDNR